MKFVLKKKKKTVLKTKTNLHKPKNLKRKKKMKRKEINKGTYTAKKKKNRIEKFETQNLRRGTAALVLVEDTEVTNREEGKT